MSTAFPNYTEIPSRIPRVGWHALRAASMVLTLAVIALLLIDPHKGLLVWWLWVLPVLPLVWIIAPGLWRNLCPMATLNQLPRLFGFSQERSLPRWLRKHGYALQAGFYLAFISTRAPWLDHNGPATAVLLLAALACAFAGGVVYKGKSGWCGSLCPLMPIQRLYGQAPAVVVPNTHCPSCVGCVKNCIDFNPRVAVVSDAHDPDPDWVNYRRIFAGTFPGFVIAFFVIPDSKIGAPADMGLGLGLFYLETLGAMAASLGVYVVLEAFFPKISPTVLMAAFGAIGLNVHNILRFNTAFHWDKPTWFLITEEVAVGVVSLLFLRRTYKQEKAVIAEAEQAAASPVVVRPGKALGLVAGDGHSVRFGADGATLVAAPKASLLTVAENAGLPIEAGCRMGMCGADPVTITDGMESLTPLTDTERATLERMGLDPERVRLACCAKVCGPVEAELGVTDAPVAPKRSGPSRVVVPGVERVVIVGNGIAGSTVADHVRRAHADCAIDIVGDEAHPLYNRMGISRVVYGRSAMQGLHLLSETWYTDRSITTWLNTTVLGIDRAAGAVDLGTKDRLRYDRLILATGAAAALPPLVGTGLPGVYALRRADDAILMRAEAQRRRARTAVVVGGGLLGLEAAYALHKLGLKVGLLHRGNRLMDRQLDVRGGELVSRYFRVLGIEAILGARVAAITGADRVEGVALEDGTELAADLVLFCVGLAPHADLARDAGLEVSRGVVVDDQLRTSDPNVYAAGDVAEHEGVITGLWSTALAQAQLAGTNAVCADPERYVPEIPVALLKGAGLHVLSIGEVELQPGDRELVTDDSTDGAPSYRRYVVRDGRVVGAVLIGDDRDGLGDIATKAVRAGRIDARPPLLVA